MKRREVDDDDRLPEHLATWPAWDAPGYEAWYRERADWERAHGSLLDFLRDSRWRRAEPRDGGDDAA